MFHICRMGSSTWYIRTKGEGRGQAKYVRLRKRGKGGFKVTYVRKKTGFFGPHNLKTFLFLYKRNYYIAINILKVRTHKGGSSQMRTIAYKGKGGQILAIFVRMYYVDDPDRLFARIASLQAF